jgi:hypothetical protein
VERELKRFRERIGLLELGSQKSKEEEEGDVQLVVRTSRKKRKLIWSWSWSWTFFSECQEAQIRIDDYHGALKVFTLKIFGKETCYYIPLLLINFVIHTS